MKKIILKLDRHSIQTLIDFLDYSLTNVKEFDYDKRLGDKLILCTITELHEKLCDIYNPYKLNYNAKITHSMGIGFISHCLRIKPFIPESNAITINAIIGKIDQQCA
jgi:hypothetical protein